MPANAYSVGKYGDYDYNVPIATEYAQSQPEYQDPRSASENGYIDNPASAGAPLATSGHGSIYYLPVAGPSYVTHQTDGDGTMQRRDWSPIETPSAQRVQAMPLLDRHNNTGDQTYGGSFGMFGTPSVIQSQIGGEVLKPEDIPTTVRVNPADQRWVDNPRRWAPAVTRPSVSPSDYRFMRPFDQFNRPYDDMLTGSSRNFTGEHFSMADHRREFDILGMAPIRTGRNTYRLEPTPWDEDLVDQPPAYSQVYNRLSAEEAPTGNRSYRLT